MIGGIIKFLAVSGLAFFLLLVCLKFTGAVASVLKVFSLHISVAAYKACSFFTALFWVELAVAGIFFTVIPILSLYFGSLKALFRLNVRKVVSWEFRFIKATLIGYGVCLFFGALNIPPIISVPIGFVAFSASLNLIFRSYFFAFLGYFTPSRICNFLVRKPKIVNYSGASLAVIRDFTGYVATGFIKVEGLPEADRDCEKLRDILLGLHGAKVNVGYCIKFDGSFDLYFYSWAAGLTKQQVLEEASERLVVLKETLSSRFPNLKTRMVTGGIQNLINVSTGTDIRILGERIEIADNTGKSYSGAVAISGVPSFKGERVSSLIETLLNLKVPATCLVNIEPVNGSISSGIAKQEYENRAEKIREAFEHRYSSHIENAAELYRASFIITVTTQDRGVLQRSLSTIGAVIRSEFCSEHIQVKTEVIRGYQLLLLLNNWSLRWTAPKTVLTAREAAVFIRLPVSNIPGIREAVQIELAPPIYEGEEGLKLGGVMRSGRPIGQVARIPIKSLCGHAIIFGVTRSGKSNLAKGLVLQLVNEHGLNVAVLDKHNEYRQLTSLLKREVLVINVLKDKFAVNILEKPETVDQSTHIKFVLSILRASIPGFGPLMDYLAEKSLDELYNHNKQPTISDWIREAVGLAEREGPRVKEAADSLIARLTPLTIGTYKQIFDQAKTNFPIAEILSKPAIIELAELDDETQAFVVNTVLWLIRDYRKRNTAQQLHTLIIEEAHAFIPKIYEAESSYEKMLKSPASMLFAEIGKYNEALICIEQRPSRISDDAFGNANCLIIFRLTQENDVETVVRALGFDPSTPHGAHLVKYITSLEPGYALVKTSSIPQPFEIKTELITTPITVAVSTKGHSVALPPKSDRSWSIALELSSEDVGVLNDLKMKNSVEISNEEQSRRLLDLGLIRIFSARPPVQFRLTRMGENTLAILNRKEEHEQ